MGKYIVYVDDGSMVVRYLVDANTLEEASIKTKDTLHQGEVILGIGNIDYDVVEL